MEVSLIGTLWTQLALKIRYKIYDGVFIIILSSTTANGSIVWHSGGFSAPSPHLQQGPLQKHLWKLTAVPHPFHTWKGT